VKDPSEHCTQEFATAVVFQGQAVHAAAAAGDTMPGGQERHACKIAESLDSD
jgi:hypothetical protein